MMNFLLPLSILSVALQYVNAQSPSPLTNVTQAFSKAQVVPDVITSFQPTALVNISFADAATMQSVNVTPGALLTMEQTAMEPQFFLIPSTNSSSSNISSATFVLSIVDPDAPTPQNASASQFLHFLGGGFRVDTTTPNSSLLTNTSAALLEFFPPTPPVGSDPHRYVLLVFNQTANFADDAPAFVNGSTPRNNFNLTTFASQIKLGSPIAGNFFFVGPAANGTATSSASNAMTATAPISVTSGTTVLAQTTTGNAPPPASQTTSGAIRKSIAISTVIKIISCIVIALLQ